MLDQHTSDNWNPVFWKELHLMRENRMLFTMPLIAACFEVMCLVGLYYIRLPKEIGDDFIASFSEESMVFWFYCGMGVICMLWILTQIYRTTSQERMVEGLDPLLGTRLTPIRTLSGKAASVLGCVLVCSVMELPFFLYAGRLSAADWLRLVTLFGCSMAAGIWVVMVGSIPRPAGKQGGIGLAQIAGWVPLVPLVGCYLREAFALCGKAYVVTNDDSWRRSLMILLCAVALAFFAFCLGLALLRNTRQERAWSWRLCILVLWLVLPNLLWLVAVTPSSRDYKDWRDMQAAMGFVFVAITAGLSTFERLTPSRRTLQQGNVNPMLKLLSLPFRSGVGPGMSLAWIMFLASSVLAPEPYRKIETDYILSTAVVLQAISAYLLLYSPLVALLAEHFGFKREAGCGVVFALACFLPIFAMINGVPGLARPSPFYPLFLASERTDDGTGLTITIITVALLAVVPSTIALFYYCSKYFRSNR